MFVSMIGSPSGRLILGLAQLAPAHVIPAAVPRDVDEIILTRCSMCHAKEPLWPELATPPKGIMLETPADIARAAHKIRLEAVLTHAMPPNNITLMTLEERRVLANWLSSR
jgi:uncharacterized membrane protein